VEIDMVSAGLLRLVDSRPPFDCIAKGLSFGEGPVWDRRKAQLFWVDIIDRLNSEVRSVLKLAGIQERLALEGSECGDNSPQYLGTLLKAEIAKYAKRVNVSGARAD
jgi:hypothetical protein